MGLFDMVWIAIGVMLVSWALTYAWWVKVRVVCLRQHIYDIRDQLFDYAVTHGHLDDEAYRQARRQLNAIAAGVDVITVPVVGYMVRHGVSEEALPKSDNEAMQAKIDASIEACFSRVFYYLKNETFTGVVVRRMMYLVWIGELIEEQASFLLRRWMLSDSPQLIEHHIERAEKGRLTGSGSLPVI